MTAVDPRTTTLREQLDIIAQSGRGDAPIVADITDLLTAHGVDHDHAERLATRLADTGYDQAHTWTRVGHVTQAHHVALDAAVTAVKRAAGVRIGRAA